MFLYKRRRRHFPLSKEGLDESNSEGAWQEHEQALVLTSNQHERIRPLIPENEIDYDTDNGDWNTERQLKEETITDGELLHRYKIRSEEDGCDKATKKTSPDRCRSNTAQSVAGTIASGHCSKWIANEIRDQRTESGEQNVGCTGEIAGVHFSHRISNRCSISNKKSTVDPLFKSAAIDSTRKCQRQTEQHC